MKYLTVVLAALALTGCITFSYVEVRNGEAPEKSRTESKD